QQLVEQIETLLARSASDTPATEPPLDEAPFETPAAVFTGPPPTDLVPPEEPAFVPPHESVGIDSEGPPAPAPADPMAAVAAGPRGRGAAAAAAGVPARDSAGRGHCLTPRHRGDYDRGSRGPLRPAVPSGRKPSRPGTRGRARPGGAAAGAAARADRRADRAN